MWTGPSEAELDAYIGSASVVMGLPIQPDWRPSVLANMRTIAAAAALLRSEPLDDTTEAAPIFQP